MKPPLLRHDVFLSVRRATYRYVFRMSLLMVGDLALSCLFEDRHFHSSTRDSAIILHVGRRIIIGFVLIEICNPDIALEHHLHQLQ